MAHEQTFRITHRKGSVIVMAKSETDKALWLSSLEHQMKLRKTTQIGTVASSNRIVHEVMIIVVLCVTVWYQYVRICIVDIKLSKYYGVIIYCFIVLLFLCWIVLLCCALQTPQPNPNPALSFTPPPIPPSHPIPLNRTTLRTWKIPPTGRTPPRLLQGTPLRVSRPPLRLAPPQSHRRRHQGIARRRQSSNDERLRRPLWV